MLIQEQISDCNDYFRTVCTFPHALDPRPPPEKANTELFTTAESITGLKRVTRCTTRSQNSIIFCFVFMCKLSIMYLFLCIQLTTKSYSFVPVPMFLKQLGQDWHKPPSHQSERNCPSTVTNSSFSPHTHGCLLLIYKIITSSSPQHLEHPPNWPPSTISI